MQSRLRLWLAFFFLMSVAIGLEWLVQAMGPWRSELKADVLMALAQPSLASYWSGSLATALWLIAFLSVPLIALLSFLVIETVMLGRPATWPVLRFALGIQLSLLIFYYAIGSIPFISGKWPEGWVPLPQLLIEQSALPEYLQPLAPVLLFIASVLAASFVGYWTHMARHRIPFLWRFHKVHHSLDQLCAIQNYSHPIDTFGDRIGGMIMGLVLGFSFESLILFAALKAIYDNLIHSPSPINAGRLNWLFVDNRVHFLHHSRHEEDYDCNFGSWFTIWDRLFGTWKAPPRNGLMQTGVAGVLPPSTFKEFLTARLKLDPPS